MRSLLLILVVLVFPPFAFAADPPAREPPVVRAVLWWQGLNRFSDGGGGGNEMNIDLLTGAREFARAWKDLEMKGAAPEVNFQDYFVLVVHKPLGINFFFGGLALDDRGAAKVRGIPAEPDS